MGQRPFCPPDSQTGRTGNPPDSQTGRSFCTPDPEPSAHSARQTAHSTRQTPKPDAHFARRTLILHARLEPGAPASPRTMGACGQQGGCNAPETFVMVRIRGERQGIWGKKLIFLATIGIVAGVNLAFLSGQKEECGQRHWTQGVHILHTSYIREYTHAGTSQEHRSPEKSGSGTQSMGEDH